MWTKHVICIKNEEKKSIKGFNRVKIIEYLICKLLKMNHKLYAKNKTSVLIK